MAILNKESLQELLFSGAQRWKLQNLDIFQKKIRQITLADASQAPDTKVRMSGERERDMTSPVWPV